MKLPQKPSDSVLRKILTGAATTAAGVIAVGLVLWVPTLMRDVHADEHAADAEELQTVKAIARANAQFISDQILVNLYLRAQTLSDQLRDEPGSLELRQQLAAVEVEIGRREAGKAGVATPNL